MQNNIQRAIDYFKDAVIETDEILDECTPAAKAELLEQKEHFVVALAATKQQEREPCEYCSDLGKYKGFAIEFYHQTAADETYGISLDAKYCPHCGRKLV